ncbi:MAG: hypothetical protein AcusKO_03490 [Acuticoccus sp.]
MGRRTIYIVAVGAFLAYSFWMLGPYLRSVVVRDAAVTTWARRAVAPIAGEIVGDLPAAGTVVGAGGVITTIRNTRLLDETRNVETYRDALVAAGARIAEMDAYVGELDAMDDDRRAIRAEQERAFHTQLETEIANLERRLAVTDERIRVLERIADRQEALVGRGSSAQAALDEALLRLADARSRRAEINAALAFARARDEATERGVFMTAAGETPDWVNYSELEIELERRRAGHRRREAEAMRTEAQRDLAVAERTLESLRQAPVTAPAGSIVESVVAAPGETMAAGDTVALWIDCSEPMVDVPVSDAELPLIAVGGPAEIVLEGDRAVRAGTVVMTRGSTATLGEGDLVAVAKGRSPGEAQVLVRLAEVPQGDCPVGRAAFVEFPGVGLIDVLRARLRL